MYFSFEHIIRYQSSTRVSNEFLPWKLSNHFDILLSDDYTIYLDSFNFFFHLIEYDCQLRSWSIGHWYVMFVKVTRGTAFLYTISPEPSWHQYGRMCSVSSVSGIQGIWTPVGVHIRWWHQSSLGSIKVSGDRPSSLRVDPSIAVSILVSLHMRNQCAKEFLLPAELKTRFTKYYLWFLYIYTIFYFPSAILFHMKSV